MALARDTTAPTRTAVDSKGRVVSFDAALGGLDYSFGTPVPATATRVNNTAIPSGASLSFGDKVASLDFPTSSNLSYATGSRSVPTQGQSGFLNSFLSTFRTSADRPVVQNSITPPRNTSPSPAALLGSLSGLTSTGVPSPVAPQQNVANVDGGAGFLSDLSALAQSVRGVTGGGDAPQAQRVSFSSGGEAGGINPLYVVGGAILIGGLYYLTAK